MATQYAVPNTQEEAQALMDEARQLEHQVCNIYAALAQSNYIVTLEGGEVVQRCKEAA